LGARGHGSEFPELQVADARRSARLRRARGTARARAHVHARGHARPHLPAERFHAAPVQDAPLGGRAAEDAMKRASDTEVRPSGQSIANRYSGKTVVAIGAHPDDLEIGIGGTLAKLQRNGAHVVMCVASIPKDYEVRLAEAQRG